MSAAQKFNAGTGAGTVMVIGGAEAKSGRMDVLRRVMSEARGGRVLVVTTATSFPDEARDKYNAAFGQLDTDGLDILHIASRAEAADDAAIKTAQDADVIFFSGGDQLKLTHLLGATPFMDAVRAAHRGGAVIAGTSAGAAALSGLMLYGGTVEDAGKRGGIKAAAGFGFVGDAVIDTHFSQRGRLPRLFNLVAANPGVTGIGVDEDTALVIRADGSATVAGSGTVTIVDGRNCVSDIGGKDVGDAFTADGFDVQVFAQGESVTRKFSP